MSIDSLTVSLPDKRLIDGWVEAANRASVSPEALMLDVISEEGRKYANLYKVGVVTTSAFILRLMPDEYAAIVAAAEQSPEIAEMVEQFSRQPEIALDDERLRSGLLLLAGVVPGIADRIPDLLAYTRPEPAGPSPEPAIMPEPAQPRAAGDTEGIQATDPET